MKWLLAIPHLLVLNVLSLGAPVAVVIAWCVVLFTECYPRPFHDFVVGVVLSLLVAEFR